MLTNRFVRTSLILLILASNIGCDQMSKSIVRKSIPPFERIHFFDNHVMVTRVENTGAFLSMGNSLSASLKFFVLILVPVIALIVALAFLFVKNSLSRSYVIGMAFVIGGGIGNIYDRFIYGSVTDFLHIDFYVFRTGIFNMADVSIMVGAVLMGITALMKRPAIVDFPGESV
jgi:signal peptidase II